MPVNRKPAERVKIGPDSIASSGVEDSKKEWLTEGIAVHSSVSTRAGSSIKRTSDSHLRLGQAMCTSIAPR